MKLGIARRMQRPEDFKGEYNSPMGASREEELAHWLAGACLRMEMPQRAVAILEEGVSETPATAATKQPFELLCLAGPVGVGKSVAAAAWLWEQITRDVGASASGLFLSGAHLARWNRYDDAAMKRILGIQRLVLDDLGNEYADEKGAYLSTLNEVVITRYDNRRATLITTNLTPAAFRGRYGDRVADRINENKGFVAMTGASLRQSTD